LEIWKHICGFRLDVGALGEKPVYEVELAVLRRTVEGGRV
jgi:hypothetical protein